MNNSDVNVYVMQQIKEHKITDEIIRKFENTHVPFMSNTPGSNFRPSAYQAMIA